MFATARRVPLIALTTALIAATAACGSSDDSGSGSSGSSSAAAKSGSADSNSSFPLTFKNSDGTTTEIKSQPKNIVSTSVVLTGDMLAIDAPVKASGASVPNVPGDDDQGFFTQWSAVAKEKGVKALYSKSELNLEAVTAAKPDLIVVGQSGGDSQYDKVAQLKKIAPVIVVNYLTQDWQGVTKQLAEATGHTADYDKTIKGYNEKMAAYKAAMNPPAEEVQSIVFQGKTGAAFVLPNSTYDDVYKSLGIKLAPTDKSLAEKGEGGNAREDVAFMSPENAIKSLKSKILLMLDADADTLKAFKSETGYATSPATGKDGKIVTLGHETFKIDYYSALLMGQRLSEAFKK